MEAESGRIYEKSFTVYQNDLYDIKSTLRPSRIFHSFGDKLAVLQILDLGSKVCTLQFI